MPPKTKQSSVARNVGAIAGSGTAGQTIKRGRRKGYPEAAAVIGDSIFTITFKPKTGPEVYCALEHIDISELFKVYEDLCSCYARCFYLIYKQRLDQRFPWLNESLEVRLAFLLRNFKSIIPGEFEINVDKDEQTGDYFFTIYRECTWNMTWHYFAVGPALIKLRRENKSLHDLFLSFLKAFASCGIDLWTDGLMKSSIECLDDRVLNYEDEADPVSMDQFKGDVRQYLSGDPKNYSKKIKGAPRIASKKLANRAKRYKAGNPIANLIFQGAPLLTDGNNVCNYRYLPAGEDMAGYFLDLESQLNVIWREDDFLFHEHCENLDSMASEGLQVPVVALRIDSKTKEIDFGILNKKVLWIKQLSDFFGRAMDLINTYTV